VATRWCVIPTLEPLRGSKAHVGALLDSVNSAVELVEQLTHLRRPDMGLQPGH